MLLGSFGIAYCYFAYSCSLKLPSATQPFRLYSNQLGSNLHQLFVEALSHAHQSIFLEVYSITEKNILRLLEAQRRKGLLIHILSDKKASPQLKKQKNIGLSFHRGRGLMHRKIVLIDDELILIGSTNFTKASLTMHDNLVIALFDRKLAQFLKQIDAPFSYHEKTWDVWKLPEAGKEALAHLEKTIQSAKKTIHIALFTFTHEPLALRLIDAHQRGVKLSIAIDRYAAEGSSKKICTLLKTAGIPILISQGMALLHHKWVLIDGEILITGSANWTKSAFEKNKELLMNILLEKPDQAFMSSLWKTIQTSSIPL